MLSVVIALAAACAGSDDVDDAGDGTAVPGAGASAGVSTDLVTPVTDAATAATTSATVAPSTTSAPPSTSTTTAPTSTTTTTTTTTTASTSTTSTTTTTTLPPVPFVPGPLDLSADVAGLGRSVEGRPIHAERYGTPGGVRVLVIGVIHGDEDDGIAIVEALRNRPVPEGIELWLVESMNPDGQLAQDRHNANEVDLNRNFPYNWGPIGEPGNSQYAGTGPASEPETQAMVNFISQLNPDLAIWYHQDLFVINPSSGREGAVRERYAELTGLPMGQITGGTYTGIAATWARRQLAPSNGVAFIVELGPTLSPAEADAHTSAVLTVATELPTL